MRGARPLELRLGLLEMSLSSLGFPARLLSVALRCLDGAAVGALIFPCRLKVLLELHSLLRPARSGALGTSGILGCAAFRDLARLSARAVGAGRRRQGRPPKETEPDGAALVRQSPGGERCAGFLIVRRRLDERLSDSLEHVLSRRAAAAVEQALRL